jgi:hypothetical protein
MPDFIFETDRDTSGDLLYVTSRVDRFAIKTQIEFTRNPPRNSVALNSAEKQILRHYVEQIKQVIDESNLVIAKKERLYDALNAFVVELDRDRTPLQSFSDVVVGLARTGGEAINELEPAWKWVKLIGNVLGSRQENEQPTLPRPPTPKQIEPPKSPKKDEFDEEIPF